MQKTTRKFEDVLYGKSRLACQHFLRLAIASCALTTSDAWIGHSSAIAQQPASSFVELAAQPQMADTYSAEPSMESGLTLEMLQNLAVEYHPSLQSIAALAQAARGRGFQNGTQLNPQLGFNGQQLGSNGRAEQYGIELGQEFVQREKLRLNREIGERESRRLFQEWQSQRQRILTDVRIVFYRAARAENQVQILTELVGVSKQVAQLSSGLFEQGELSKSEQLLSELEVDSAEILLENARNRQTAAWREMAAVTNQPQLPIQPLASDLFSPALEFQFEDALNRILQQSPEIATVLASIEKSQSQVRREVIDPRPNVTVLGLVNVRDNGIDGNRDGGLLVSIPIPVWNQNRGAIQEARSQLIAAQRQLSALELELQGRLVPVFERYSNARVQTQRYRDVILPKSQTTLELARKAYSSGDVSFINTLLAQRVFAQNQIAYLESIEALRVSEAEIEGLLLAGSLTSAPQ